MAPPLDTRLLLRESAPVAVILTVWVVLSTMTRPVIAAGLLRAGVIMALLYTIVRGIELSQSLQIAVQPTDLQGLLRENVRVAVPAGAWFLVGQLVYFVERLWNDLDLPGLFTSPADGLAYIFSGAGVAVVFLYAICVGLQRTHHSPSGP